MSVLSSPTSNPYDILKIDNAPRPKGKPAPKSAVQVQPGTRMTPEQKRLRSLEEAEKKKEIIERKKMEEALARQNEEEARAQGFQVAHSPQAKKTNTQKNQLGFAAFHAARSKGETLVTEEPKEVVQEERKNNNNNNNNNNGQVKENTQKRHEPRRDQHHDNDGRRAPKREGFDKHSQSGYSRKPHAKREGGGKFNVGKETDLVEPVVEQQETAEVNADNTTETTTSAGDAETKEPETTAAPVEVKVDPMDEGFGKKTLADYEKERKAAAEALEKLVGTVEKRTELEKKIDLSKCIEVDHAENRPILSKAKNQQPKAKQAKAKTVDFHELAKEQGVVQQANNPRNYRGPNPGNRKLQGQNAFPALGEEPSPKNPDFNNQREQNRPPRQQREGGNNKNFNNRSNGNGNGNGNNGNNRNNNKNNSNSNNRNNKNGWNNNKNNNNNNNNNKDKDNTQNNSSGWNNNDNDMSGWNQTPQANSWV